MIWTPKPKPEPQFGQWARWFAWYPVKLVDGRKAWLCYLERRILYADWKYVYRVVK